MNAIQNITVGQPERLKKPVGYTILANLFSCKMTILGDRAQTMDVRQQDVLKFLPRILGRDLHKIEMNKSYRNTVEIAEYAAKISGIEDLILLDRHGKEVAEQTFASEDFLRQSFFPIGHSSSALPSCSSACWMQFRKI